MMKEVEGLELRVESGGNTILRISDYCSGGDPAAGG